MAGGLAALLDDVAVLARKAAVTLDDVAALTGQTATRSTALIIDDAAVTPSLVQGASPARELPVIWRITKGSLRNKLLIVLPIILLLAWLAPWVMSPILMVGGAYLAFEGAEKIWEYVSGKGHGEHRDEEGPAAEGDQAEPYNEDKMVKNAITTDLILSAEIMVISFNAVSDQPFWTRLLTLIAVGVIVTVGVYGVVGLLIKIDDMGLSLIKKNNNEGGAAAFGRFMVKGMPYVLTTLSVIGTAAMLWVGGHILISGASDLGWHWPADVLHSFAELGGDNGFMTWLLDTVGSAIVGLVVGLIITAIVMAVHKAKASSQVEQH